ncbi:MAG: hypothetical protein D6744_07840, partial [Planctomycetota bacterium]
STQPSANLDQPINPAGLLPGAPGAADEGSHNGGKPIVVPPPDQPPISVDDAGLLEVHVRETPLTTVLEMLSYQSRTSIVASNAISGNISANLYGVTLTEALDAILLPNQLAYRRVGNVIFVGSAEEVAAHRAPPETRVFTLHYLGRAEAITAVSGVLSPDGVIAGEDEADQQSTGGGGDLLGEHFGDASFDRLIITDFPENLDAVGRLLDQIDERPKQVLIEATILRATLNEDNQFGIDLTLLSGVDFQNVNSFSNAAADLTTGPLRPDDFQQTTLNVNTNLIGNVPGGGFTFGIIKNDIGAFVRALEDVTDVAVIANPKLVTLNKAQAEIIVGRRDGYLTTTVTQTAAVQTVEFLETGTQIKLRPVINPNGTVRMFVQPKDSNGGLTADNLPFEETTEAHNELLVDDGNTILIGGLFRERTVSSRSQVPLVGDIPVAGALFQKHLDQTVREEVIILLTVHVLTESDAEQQEFRELLEDVERVRVGSRRGLLGIGRERLAQAFYQEALSKYEQGDLDAALLNVRLSLHNQPRQVAALRLKEKLLQQREWESDGTRVRGFLLNLLGESAPAGPAAPRGWPPAHRRLLDPVNDAPDASSSEGDEE